MFLAELFTISTLGACKTAMRTKEIIECVEFMGCLHMFWCQELSSEKTNSNTDPKNAGHY